MAMSRLWQRVGPTATATRSVSVSTSTRPTKGSGVLAMGRIRSRRHFSLAASALARGTGALLRLARLRPAPAIYSSVDCNVTVTAPEPRRDPPPAPPPQRRAQNPLVLARDQTSDQSTEFGWGAGLVPLHANGRPPSEDGIYMPRCPRVDPPASGVGQPRPHRRPRNEARGYPGDPVCP